MSTLRVRHWMPRIDDTLGPGRRVAVWVQGCGRGCPGCIAPEMWPADGGRAIAVGELAGDILAQPGHEGLTVSGGEPFEQAAGVADLLERVRGAGWNSWVYTGFRIEDLVELRDSDVDRALAATDVLVDGPFDAGRAGSFAFRGSANQRILPLSGAIPRERIAEAQGARLQVTLDDAGEMIVVGIPPPGFLERLHTALSDRGIAVVSAPPRR